MIILKFTKNQSFTLSLEDTLFEKPQGRGEIDHPSRFKVKPLKDKKGKTVRNAFMEIVNESYHKPNKLMYSIHHEGKLVSTARFIKTLKFKIFKRTYRQWQQILSSLFE